MITFQMDAALFPDNGAVSLPRNQYHAIAARLHMTAYMVFHLHGLSRTLTDIVVSTAEISYVELEKRIMVHGELENDGVDKRT